MFSAADKVWELSDLRHNILRFLGIKNVVPLLTVDQTFFQYAVERIYENYRYFNYKATNRKFQDSRRMSIYRDAVRTLNLNDEYDIPQPPTEWLYLFTLFPNARTITRDREHLHRFSIDGTPKYTYERSQILQLVESRMEWDVDDSRNLPKEGIEGWTQRTLVHLYFFSQYLPNPMLEEKRKTDLYTLLRDHLTPSHVIPYRVSLDVGWGTRQLLDLIRHPKILSGSVRLEEIFSWQIDQDLVDMLHSQVNTIRIMRLIRPVNDIQPYGLTDLMCKLRWGEFRNLRELHIKCDRYITPTSSAALDIPQPVSHAAPGYGLIHLQITIYYPDGPPLSSEQMVEEKKVIRGFARCIATLCDPQKLPWHPPWIECRFKARCGDDEYERVNEILQEVFVREVRGCLSLGEDGQS
ncbi:hypothetical protein I302_101366 [Kwoniella bestiolae CBS 10118]|uniref:Uncharacterized protein n=1 Tax=Kwoniella bestiolae CBS 10118 TaxID=1296100 RepID=A0A1B9GC15_9TREE|nr:hypothetical protein I302_00049 [Kwoniella bestiolae CBS 10118]OCF28561.1 hypothetical protein I302_00049 [Kwoniella bestiolae CBS 10118]